MIGNGLIRANLRMRKTTSVGRCGSPRFGVMDDRVMRLIG